VHASNFRVIGFTSFPALAELVAAAHRHNVLLLDDLGSGCLLDTRRFGMLPEPTVQESVAAGVDVIAFSGDKLLGGPQAGILAGRQPYIDAARSHPLARAVPLLAGLLDEPVVEVPGAHHDMPRIQGPDYGASERFSVSPGAERAGYFHMPGGESGHPLSPFYRAGFEAWRDGRPTPFLPGTVAHRLLLSPP